MNIRTAFIAAMAGLFLSLPAQLVANGYPPLGDLWYGCVKDGGKLYGLTTEPPAECNPGDTEITLTSGDLNWWVELLRDQDNQLSSSIVQLEDLEMVSLNLNVYSIIGTIPIWIWEVPISHGVESVEPMGVLPNVEVWKVVFDREDVSDCVFTGTPNPKFTGVLSIDFDTRFTIITENMLGGDWPHGPNAILVGSTACGEGPPCDPNGFSVVGHCGTPDDPPVTPTP
ncbi:MAG: hypothetical protein HKN57_01460 [Xanthomonadales bacterium]|nr:hypothetical protein [Gammaproteobacteria bacterium]NND55897.1 hypothetical protein [Xanthomonadales bacterium]NNK50595.1 hypothetical protein [Xanthomonadales bacterium]